MKELDLSAGGFPERTYVGKNTTVADVVEYISKTRSLIASFLSLLDNEPASYYERQWDDWWERYSEKRAEIDAALTGVPKIGDTE